MQKKDVLYDGVVLDKSTVDRLISLAKENGIDIPAGTVPEATHFTLHFFGYGDKKGQMTGEEIGTKVQLNVTEIGILSVDGEVQNIGFRLDDKSLSGQAVGDRTLGELSVNKIPHITISVQGEGKAVNTQACFEPVSIKDKKGKPIDETRIDRTVIPVSGVQIEGITAAFAQHQVEKAPGVMATVTEVATKEFDDEKSDRTADDKGSLTQMPLTDRFKDVKERCQATKTDTDAPAKTAVSKGDDNPGGDDNR